MRFPTTLAVSQKLSSGKKLTPLEEFMLNYGQSDKRWRDMFSGAMEEVAANTKVEKKGKKK